jgi:hypothetical protein
VLVLIHPGACDLVLVLIRPGACDLVFGLAPSSMCDSGSLCQCACLSYMNIGDCSVSTGVSEVMWRCVFVL